MRKKPQQPKSGPRRAFGTAVLLWNLWRRIPPKHRRKLLAQARKHGPRLVKTAYRARRARASFRR